MKRATTRSRPRLPVLLALVVLPTAVLLLCGELAARLYAYYLHRDARFLILPFGDNRSRHQVAYPYRAERTYQTRHDLCSGREILFTVNAAGGRGSGWAATKSPGVLRVLAVGESSTFGVNSPDGATWPAFLQRALRRQHGEVIEVWNGGQGAVNLSAITELLRRWLPQYAPDVVIYYGAYNDANPIGERIARFRAEWLLGRLTSWLYYRSLLYTSLVEKVHFATQFRGNAGLAPDIAPFRRLLVDLIGLARQHKAVPVFVLQATRLRRDRLFELLPPDDRAAVHDSILTLADRSPSVTSRERIERIRSYRTQLLVALAGRVGIENGIQVIDPRPALEAADERVFCDEIHLADSGNQVLADAIASRLVFPKRAARREAASSVILPAR